jgi:branched-chain amino acid transport system permease protein
MPASWAWAERWWWRALFGAALVAALLAGVVVVVAALGSATDQRIAMTFLINLIVAVGLQTYVGNSGVISFGHVGFMALGAYGAALFTASPVIKARAIPDAPTFIVEAEMGFVPAMLIGAVIAMAVAYLIGLTIVRLAGAAAAVATLGFLVLVFIVLSNADDLTRGAKAFSGIPPYANLWWGLVLAALCILGARLLRDSGMGLGLRASRGDELAAQASGVDVVRGRLVMWVAGAAMAAVGGALYAHVVLAILPKAFHFDLTFLIVTMVIVGGQSISGAALGAGLITLLAELLRRAEHGFAIGPLSLEEAPGLTTIVLGLLIVLTLILRPRGLLGRWELDELLLRRLAARAGLHVAPAQAQFGARPRS